MFRKMLSSFHVQIVLVAVVSTLFVKINVWLATAPEATPEQIASATTLVLWYGFAWVMAAAFASIRALVGTGHMYAVGQYAGTLLITSIICVFIGATMGAEIGVTLTDILTGLLFGQ